MGMGMHNEAYNKLDFGPRMRLSDALVRCAADLLLIFMISKRIKCARVRNSPVRNSVGGLGE